MAPADGINLAFVKNTDTTFSKENKAADAKATGEKIKETNGTEYPITVKQSRKHNIYILEREKIKKQKKHLKK